MIQQINLYQQAVRPVKVLLPAPLMALVAVLACALLASYAVFLFWQVDDLEAEVARINREASEVQDRLAAVQREASAASEDTALLMRAESLQRARDAKIPVLEIFRERKDSSPHGFSPALEALARQSVDGLWLRRIVVGNSRESMLVLEGSSLDPQLLPRYLKGLAGEDPFSGYEFSSFGMTRPEGNGARVDFTMQTTEKME